LWVGAVLLLASLAGCGRIYRAEPAPEDGYSVTLIVVPEQPVMGPSTLFAGLKDPAGQPVDGARLDIEANMSHAGMVPVLAGTTESRDGLYRVPLTWTMAGDWYVDVVFTLPDGSRVVRRYPVGVK
jgi:hypothetical protein